MREEGTVTHVPDALTAVVAVRRRSACGHDCASCGGCGHGGATLLVSARNEAGARAGDRVTLESASAVVLGLAGMLYLMPVALLLAGYFAWPGGEGGKIAAGLLGLALGLGLCVAVSRRIGRRGRPCARIVSATRPSGPSELR